MEHSMKWYKFVIYVQLFLSALINLYTAVMDFTGGNYGSEADMVYAYYGGLKVLDVLMGIVSLALAVLALIVRQKLKNYKADGPKWYISLLAFSIIVSVAYMLLVYLVTGVQVLDSSIVVSLVGNVILLTANKKYFDNRKDLFIY